VVVTELMMPAVVMDTQTRAAHSASEPDLECSRRVIARPTGGQRQPFIINNGKFFHFMYDSV
jgi:hypothetical protein